MTTEGAKRGEIDLKLHEKKLSQKTDNLSKHCRLNGTK